MKPHWPSSLFIRRIALAAALAAACLLRADSGGSGAVSGRMADFPRLMLWAWERPEDLRFIDPREVGVAFLARTVTLRGEDVLIRPRLQPVEVPPGTQLIAVARVETDRRSPPAYSAEQKGRLVAAIAELADLPGVQAVQVDYDAAASERAFYRNVLVESRRSMARSVPLSITALASWCLDDHWLDGLPIDEAVPMLFRMGPDGEAVRRRLEAGEDFEPTLCRASVGISTDEPLPYRPTGRRVYVFEPNGWSSEAVSAALREARTQE